MRLRQEHKWRQKLLRASSLPLMLVLLSLPIWSQNKSRQVNRGQSKTAEFKELRKRADAIQSALTSFDPDTIKRAEANRLDLIKELEKWAKKYKVSISQMSDVRPLQVKDGRVVISNRCDEVVETRDYVCFAHYGFFDHSAYQCIYKCVPKNQIAMNAKKQLRVAEDPRAEDEYKQAIADHGRIYPEAWQWLSTYLAHSLRFEEAATAWRKYLKQTKEKVSPGALEHLKRLDRGASLKAQSENGQRLTQEEMLELVALVDAFGQQKDAITYAEKAVELYPESGKALVTLAELIKREQRDRALELLNRAIAFEPNEPSNYVIRGGYFFWVHGNSSASEADFRRAIELSKGSNPSAWAGLGDSLAREGRRDEAISAYRKYLSIRPKSAAHYDGEIRKSIEMLQNSSSKP